MTKVAEGKIPDLQKQVESILARGAEIGAEVRDSKFLSEEVGLYCASIIAEVTDSMVDIKETLDWLVRSKNIGVVAPAIMDSTLARVTQRLKHNTDLLNQAVRTIDGDLDIWGNQLPRGGLWDK